MQNLTLPATDSSDFQSTIQITQPNHNWNTAKIITVVGIAAIFATSIAIVACTGAALLGAPILIAASFSLKITAFMLAASIAACAATALAGTLSLDSQQVIIDHSAQTPSPSQAEENILVLENERLRLDTEHQRIENEQLTAERNQLSSEGIRLREHLQNSLGETTSRISTLERQITQLESNSQTSLEYYAGCHTRDQVLIYNVEFERRQAQEQLRQAQEQLSSMEIAARALVTARPLSESTLSLSLLNSSLSASRSLQTGLLGYSTLHQLDLEERPSVDSAVNSLEQSILQYAPELPVAQEAANLHAALEALAAEQLTEADEASLLTWLSNALPLVHRLGGALVSGVGATVYGVSTVASAVAKVINANMEHNHPWKQKKYEIAIKELKNQFMSLCTEAYDLRAFQTPIGLEVSRLLVMLMKAATNQDVDYRFAYYEMIIALRAIITSQEYQNIAPQPNVEEAAIRRIVQDLCQARYGHVHMYTFCEQLIEGVVAAGGGKPDNLGVTLADFEAIERAPAEWKGVELSKNIGKLKGHSNINFDPAVYCNVPFVLGDLPIASGGQIKNIRLFRMGVPTIQSLESFSDMLNEWNFIGTEVDPIWKEFVAVKEKLGQVHLYVSFQNDIPALALNGDESRRNTALKELARARPAFKFVVMAQDSDFYHQRGKHAQGSVGAGTFKAQFITELLGNSVETGFYFPEDWKNDPQFNEDLLQMLKGLHAVLYQEACDLDIYQRQNFIEIFEACLFLHLLVKSQADTANGTCKDAIDRAVKTLTLVQHIAMIGQGKADDAELKQVQKIYAHAPAFMVKKQAMIKSRRERLIAATEVLNLPEVADRMRAWLQENQALFGLVDNTHFQIERKEGCYFQ